jgi:DNA-binding response OmpR family regulator
MGRPVKILLIEDSLRDATLMQELLRRSNGPFEVEWVSRLESGIERLKRAEADVVLLDLDVADAHGVKGLLTTREAAGSIPIIALGSARQQERRLDALASGAGDFLAKETIHPHTLRLAVLRQLAAGAEDSAGSSDLPLAA